MGELGWQTQKRIHELRAWAGSKVLERYGVYEASQFLRHKDVRTTQKYYLRYIQMKGLKVEMPG